MNEKNYKEVLEKLSDAVEDGNVEILGQGTESRPQQPDLLVEDETGNLIYLVKDTKWSKEAFGLRIDDGGGYTGLILTPAQWYHMKIVIDEFLDTRGTT